jgi:phage major head subunit gpT-like protein
MKKNEIRKAQIIPLSLRADVQPQTINEEERSVELVWSTGAKVRRGGFFSDPYDEELSMDPQHIRMGRMNKGAPLLNSHSQWNLRDVIGVIENARIENGVGKAKVRFSSRAEVDPIFKDVKDGILRNVSVGYRVYKYKDVSGPEDKYKTYRAIDWEPAEVSIVPVPADADAQIRSAPGVEKNEVEIEERNLIGGDSMKENEQPTPAAAQPPVDKEAIRKEVLETERARISSIKSAVRAAKLDEKFADEMIDGGVAIEKAREMIIEKLASKTEEVTVAANVRVGGQDEVQTRRDGMQEALLHRTDGKKFELTEKGREYRHMTLLELARESLEARGVRTRGFSKMELAARALHSTSDFKLVLENVINKTLRAGYESAPQTFRPFVREVQVADFKEISRVQLGDAPKLLEVKEGGEFKRGTTKDSAEKYALKTYGRIIGVTRQVLINDDLDAFTRIPQMFGSSAAHLESDVVYGILNANAALSDGIALFHASHNNLGTAGAPDVTTLTEARRALRQQKGLSELTEDLQFINIMARYLIVPPKYETASEQLLSSTMLPNQVSAVNPFAGKLQLLVEPRLEVSGSDPWYVAADPGQVDVIEVATLQGQGSVYLETKEGFDVDGLEVKARHDFAAKAIDYRGLFKNPGTA